MTTLTRGTKPRMWYLLCFMMNCIQEEWNLIFILIFTPSNGDLCNYRTWNNARHNFSKFIWWSNILNISANGTSLYKMVDQIFMQSPWIYELRNVSYDILNSFLFYIFSLHLFIMCALKDALWIYDSQLSLIKLINCYLIDLEVAIN